ncbi:MAG: hypothetical protein FWG50_04365 [Kiritimatiellaeota bacterium]|nr:hypothetical protein [Kiritimatiellota bacterium]
MGAIGAAGILVSLFVLYILGVIANEVIYLRFFADARIENTGTLIRVLSARLGCINEAGEYPPSLESLVDRLGRANPSHTYSKWNGIYYVGGLKLSDPPAMPIWFRQDLIMYVGGDWGSIKDIEPSKRKLLMTAPWELVRDEFRDVEEYKAFTNRLKLIKTEGLK